MDKKHEKRSRGWSTIKKVVSVNILLENLDLKITDSANWRQGKLL